MVDVFVGVDLERGVFVFVKWAERLELTGTGAVFFQVNAI